MTSPYLTMQQIKQMADEFFQPEVMDKIIKATHAVLGEDVPINAVGIALQSAAGYIYAIETGNRNPSEMFIMASINGLHLGASMAPCQCDKCKAKRASAKASSDALLRKAAGR